MVKLTILKKNVIIALLSVFTIVLMMILPGAKNQSDVSSDDADRIILPIIMYHSLLKDKNLQNDYTISPSLFEEDLKYLTKNGYKTVTVSDLVDYVYHGGDLPQRCVMLTFDDGCYNNYYYAYPLLGEYQCRAVISPIASATERFTQSESISVTYGYISDENIREMVSSGLVEIQNHSYDMHRLTPRRGAEQKIGESDSEYREAITSDIKKAQNYLSENAGVTPECFVYPFGAKSGATLDIIKELGFMCTLTCTEKPNVITRDPESLFELGRYRRRAEESMGELLERILNNSTLPK